MELREYLNLVLKNWWIIVSLFLVTLVAGMIMSFREAPLYQSESSFMIAPTRSAGDLGELPYVLGEVSRSGVPDTYCTVLTSSSIREAAARSLRLDVGSLAGYNISCARLPDTNNLILSVVGPNPRLAADLNTAVGDAAIAYIGSSRYQVFELLWLDRPTVNEDPISPNHPRNILLAGALGAVLGIAIALLKEYLEAPLSRIQTLSIIDAETGMYNQRYLIQRLEQEIARSRTRLRPLSMAILDVSPVEEIELYPEIIQERLKRQMNLFLTDNMREGDLLGHIEGNRYAVILPETPGDEAHQLISNLLQKLRVETFTLEDLKVSANYIGTAGIIETSGGNLERREMVARAETALSEALAEGAGTVKLSRATPRPFLTDEDLAQQPAGPVASYPFTDTSFVEDAAFSESPASPFTDISPFDQDLDLG